MTACNAYGGKFTCGMSLEDWVSQILQFKADSGID